MKAGGMWIVEYIEIILTHFKYQIHNINVNIISNAVYSETYLLWTLYNSLVFYVECVTLSWLRGALYEYIETCRRSYQCYVYSTIYW